MTENETIEFMKRYLDAECYTDKCVNAHIIAIKALTELQQYRAIGTMEELQTMKEHGGFTGVELANIAAMQMKLKEYEAIGTPEECRTAREKQMPMKPDFTKDKEFALCPCNRYLSKAKRISDGEWVVWNIFSGLYGVDIDKSTICRCTGLNEKNGNLIWENDIVKDFFSDACAQIKYGSYQSCFDSTKTEHVGFYVDWSGKYAKRYRKDLGYWINMVNAEVIGNIFDNTKLLESEE